MPALSGSSPPAWRAAGRRDALRPLVDREEAADAMAGAVGVIEPGLPQILAGEAVELASRACPSGKRARAIAIWPLRTRVKRSFISAVGVPIATVRVTSVVPSGYWPPRIDQVDRVHLDRPVGLLADPIVDDRAVGPGAGDGVEAQSRAGRRIAWRKACSFAAAPELVDAALGRLDRQPVEEARQRRAVARLGGAVAGDLDLVLDRLGQDRGVALRDDLARRPCPAPRRSPRPSAPDRPPRSCRRGAASAGSNSCALVDADAVAEMLADVVADLLRRDEQIGGAVVVDQREGQARPACARRPGRAR